MVFLTAALTVAFLVLYTLGVRSAAHHLSISLRHSYSDSLLPSLLRTQLLVLGLFFGNFILAFLTIFAAVGSVSSELENGVMQTILTRPLSRTTVIAGKYLGLGSVLVAYATLFFVAIVSIVRIFLGLETGTPWAALGLFCLVPLVLLAVTVLGSTLLPTVANGVAILSLYVVAFLGGTVEQVGALLDNVTMRRLGIISSLLLPTDALYRKLVAALTRASPDPLAAVRQMGPLGTVSEPSLWMLVYTLLYAAGLLVLAMRCFSRRDI